MTYTLAERLFHKIKLSPEPGSCWVWTGARHSNGYPVIRIGSNPSPVLAHRLIFALFDDTPTQGRRLFRNRELCDEPRCVNPQHFYVAKGSGE